MRLTITLVALAAGLVAAGSAGAGAPAHAKTYPGDIGTSRCASHWYTGSDGTATFACTKHDYRITFAVPGQDLARTVVGESRLMTVDAVVRALPRRLVLDPGIGCFTDAEHGWLAMLGTGSGYFLIAYRGSQPLAKGTSRAIHRLSEWNHVVLTCDARGSATKITLRVNGTVVVRNRDAGDALPLDRFGVWAAGQAGARLELREITATTR